MINYKIEENGIYYIWLLSNNNISYYKSVIIDNIDNKNPVINNYEVIKRKINNYYIKINATDDCEISFSKDNISYQKSNIIEGVSYDESTIYVKDCANNIEILKIKEDNNIKKYIIIALCLIMILILIIIYKSKIKRKNKK